MELTTDEEAGGAKRGCEVLRSMVDRRLITDRHKPPYTLVRAEHSLHAGDEHGWLHRGG
jgi:hypothetical protein